MKWTLIFIVVIIIITVLITLYLSKSKDIFQPQGLTFEEIDNVGSDDNDQLLEFIERQRKEKKKHGRINNGNNVYDIKTSVDMMMATVEQIEQGKRFNGNDIYQSIDLTPTLPTFIRERSLLLQDTDDNGGSEFKSNRSNGSIKMSIGEQVCKRDAELVFGVEFVKAKKGHFQWLKSDKGYFMEIDLYASVRTELGLIVIGIEYDGEQHSRYPNCFNRLGKKGFNAFKRRVKLDVMKLQLCDKNNVYLIRVPYNLRFDLVYDYLDYYHPVKEHYRRLAIEAQ